MSKIAELIDRYVAVWNEPDARLRRRRIAELWAPDGVTCHRLLDSRGHDAIEARVSGAHEKWVRTAGYVFRSRRSEVGHHDVVKFDWEMGAAGGAAMSVGQNFLVLDRDGRVRFDYQFNDPSLPAQREPNPIVDRYVAFWNEPDADLRRKRLTGLWARDGAYVSESRERRGREAIEAEAVWAYQEFVAKGFVFRSANDADSHHGVVRFHWEMRRRDNGDVAALGLDLLALDGDGRIRFDYQFDEPLPS